jgi:hypothetical protein
MIVKKIGRICKKCNRRYEPDGKYQTNCQKCLMERSRYFSTVRRKK